MMRNSFPGISFVMIPYFASDLNTLSQFSLSTVPNNILSRCGASVKLSKSLNFIGVMMGGGVSDHISINLLLIKVLYLQ